MPKKKQILDVYFQTAEAYTTRTEEWDGEEYIVVPVTMMVEGVHSGSHGPILHTAEELGHMPESWDGIPVTIGHPKVDGVYVSANSPEVLTDWAVGQIFNTNMDGDALKAEAWLKLSVMQESHADLLEKIEEGEIVEVSVGVFSDEEMTPGVYEEENYSAIARNHRPNHLALLPDEIGACSIADGCGIRVNTKGGTKVTKQKLIVNAENQSQVLKELNQKGFSVNEVGMRESLDKVRDAVYALDGNSHSNYVEEVYDGYVVFQQYNYRTEPTARKLFKQSYEVDAANNVTLTGEAVQVTREVSYTTVPQTNMKRVKTKRKLKVNTMCKEGKVDALIANKATHYTVEHRETLMSLEETVLDAMAPPAAPQANSEKKEEDKGVTRQEALNVLSNQALTSEEFMKIVPSDVREQIQGGIQANADKRNALVTSIMANAEAWTKEELEAKPMGELEKLEQTVNKADDGAEAMAFGFGGLGGQTQVQVNADQGGEPMLPAGIKFED